jgi:hypothetical protein
MLNLLTSADHHHGDMYGSRHTAKAKGIYRSSSQRHVWVKMYCQGKGYIQIIMMETYMDQVVTAKVKGIYGSSSQSHVQVRWYC